MSVQLTTEMIDAAQTSQEKFGIPASITLGQLMLESGGTYEGGLSELAYKFKNFFGITKGSNWDGETVTLSNKNGSDTQEYRVYNSVEASILDHSRVLLNSRYTNLTKDAKSITEYANAIQEGGYATDPNYASKLLKVIRDNNLTVYDSENWQGKSGNFSVENVETEENEETEVKFWGDILITIFAVLLIILAIIFFIQAFSRKQKSKRVKK